MFVSTPFGCHISDCPFRHSSPSDTAASRSSLVEKRRIYLTAPTERNLYTFVRNKCFITEESADYVAAEEESKTLAAICDNRSCAKKERTGGGKLLTCSGCGWARYCSTGCQKLCRKRHKAVCIKIDVLIEDDNMWAMEGFLKGQPTRYDEIALGPLGHKA